MKHKVDNAYEHVCREPTSEEAISDLYKALCEQATAVIYTVLRENRPDLAADVASDLWLHLSEFSGKSAFSTWTHAAARNYALNIVRSRNLRREVKLDINEVDKICHGSVEGADTLSVSSALTSQDQQLIKLLEAGYSITHIAKQLGQHRATLYRRLKKLPKLVQQ